MNAELFIAKKILFGSSGDQKVSRPVIRIALLGITLSMAVMILALAIVTGFQDEIRNKVIGFGGHIQVTGFESNNSYEARPVEKSQVSVPALSAIKGVRHVQAFATKAGILKTKEDIEGILLKGIGTDFDWSFFGSKIISGRKITISDSAAGNEVLISKYISNRLKIHLGDDITVYFIQQPPRARKFRIAGIYETGLGDFDKIFVLCDIAHIQKLNDWNKDQTGGFEILVSDFSRLKETGERVYSSTGYNLNTRTIREIYPQIFDWLGLQNMNAVIIIILMILVASINMISALLIIILERVNMIGLVKALGMKDLSVRKTFLYVAAYLVGLGILLGNIFGLSLCFLQKHFSILKLDQESYYVSVVPVHISVPHLLLLNGGTFIICVAVLIIPSYIITRISPVKAIKFS